MPIQRKNFTGQPTPKIIAGEYRNCNFSQPVPGTRIFPGDDTPRTFFECNLVNCIPPPGSTLIGGTGCNTTQVERKVEVGTEDIRIGEQVVKIKKYVDRKLGRLNWVTLKMEPKLKDSPVDPPEGSKDLKLKQLADEREAATAEVAAKEAELAEVSLSEVEVG